MELRVTNKIVALWVTVFCFVADYAIGKTTCFAPQAVLGDMAVVTCYFGYDITDTSERFSVRVRRIDHDDHDYRRDTILDCDWDGKNCMNCLTIMAGYQFKCHVSTYLTVLVLNFTHTHTGRYVCQLVPPDPGGSEPCVLSVRNVTEDRQYLDKATTTSSEPHHNVSGVQGKPPSEKTTSTAGMVAGFIVMLVVVLAVAVLAFVCRKRISKRWRHFLARRGSTVESYYKQPGVVSNRQNEHESPSATLMLEVPAEKSSEPEHLNKQTGIAVSLSTDNDTKKDTSTQIALLFEHDDNTTEGDLDLLDHSPEDENRALKSDENRTSDDNADVGDNICETPPSSEGHASSSTSSATHIEKGDTANCGDDNGEGMSGGTVLGMAYQVYQTV